MIRTIHDLLAKLHASSIRELRDSLDAFDSLDADTARFVASDWLFTARDSQLPKPGKWTTWAFIAGAGAGKTRSAAELIVRAGMYPRICGGRIAVVGRTAAEVRDVSLFGESGIMACAERLKIKITHWPSQRRLVWPSGTQAWSYSADEPKQLRGPQHGAAWLDEVSTYTGAADGDIDAYDACRDRLRLGELPWSILTMTPRADPRTVAVINDSNALVTRSTTLDNESFLPASYIEGMLARYRLPNGEYTRIGRQELLGEILDANEGALWRRGDIRYEAAPKKLDRVVVGVDPAMSCTAASDETGIVVVGESCGRLYVLEDLSGRYTPTEWATTVIAATERYPGSSIVAEKNQGGVLVEATIRTLAPRCAYKGVHASKGKYARAEPIVALYEQGKVSHVAPFEQLEKQMLTLSLRSPDRMDALVYACTALAEGSETSARGILQWARSRS